MGTKSLKGLYKRHGLKIQYFTQMYEKTLLIMIVQKTLIFMLPLKQSLMEKS